MEFNSVQIQDKKYSSSSFLKKAKNSSKCSKTHKKLKGKKKLEDISSQILVELRYENFEQETETFYPKIFRKENKISLDNVSLLDQSHFRFLVNKNSNIFNNYTKYKQNNFKNINWNDIELVNFYYNDDYCCPICLESKLCCPVISECGHVFCYPCIISLYNYHMNISENKKIPNCPLCSSKIEINSDNGKINLDNDGTFKLCQKIKSINYNNNMKINFNLILKEKKSPTLYNLVYDPLLDNWKLKYKDKMKELPNEEVKEFSFSRIFLENKQLMNKRLNEYKNDLNLLKKEFDSTSDELKKQSITECINQIDSLIKKYKNQKDNTTLSDMKKAKKNDRDNNEESDSDDSTDINYKKYHLFYQEEKGDIYYLHPFIMEILLTEYGDYNSLPVELEGKILDIEMNQVTPKLKSEYKYLNHLRIGSIIFFVEIDINDMISSSTKKIYQEKLDERNRLRNLLKNQEKNYEDFVNKRNNKLFEEEKNNSLENSKKSLEQISISGPIFFGTDEELGKNQKKEKNEEKDNKKNKENKLKLLFIEKEKEEKEEKEKKEKEEKMEKEKIEMENQKKKEINEKEKENKKEKKKNKNGGNKKNKNNGGKKGKKKKGNDIKEKVFNSASEDDIPDTDF